MQHKPKKYPLAVRKWETDCYYIYFNDVDSPIDAKKIWKYFYKYDTLKGFDLWDPVEVKSVLD